MVENITRIKSGITISVGVSVKMQKDISAKIVIFEILQNEAAKMVNMQDILLVIQ